MSWSGEERREALCRVRGQGRAFEIYITVQK